jgi:SAM-dependent methyltransferase
MPESQQSTPRVPLEVCFCRTCGLSQLTVDVVPEFLYGPDYPYYSSVSPELSRHFEASAQKIIAARHIGPGASIVEAASNDGYLLRHFKAAGARTLGLDPAEGPARFAQERGIETRTVFFGADAARDLVAEGIRADVFLANNVLAHVPDLTGFVEGIATILQPSGLAVIEVPYMVDLVRKQEFDTIYHQHLCYFLVTNLSRLFAGSGLCLANVERITVQGGSLRLYIVHGPQDGRDAMDLIDWEEREGFTSRDFIGKIGDAAEEVCSNLLNELERIAGQGLTVCAYAAAGKATTLLSWCGLDKAELNFVADLNPHKHGLFMPGTDLEIVSPDTLRERKPDYVVILAWNLAGEIMQQLSDYHTAGGHFIVPLPELRVI